MGVKEHQMICPGYHRSSKHSLFSLIVVFIFSSDSCDFFLYLSVFFLLYPLIPNDIPDLTPSFSLIDPLRSVAATEGNILWQQLLCYLGKKENTRHLFVILSMKVGEARDQQLESQRIILSILMMMKRTGKRQRKYRSTDKHSSTTSQSTS